MTTTEMKSKQMIDETRTVVVELDDETLNATFSYNLSGSGYIRILSMYPQVNDDQSWFFRLEAAGVYVNYYMSHLKEDDPQYDGQTYVLNAGRYKGFRYKTNGKSGGLGKAQEARAAALWLPLNRLMEKTLRAKGWQWVGFNSQHDNASMYRRPNE